MEEMAMKIGVIFSCFFAMAAVSATAASAQSGGSCSATYSICKAACKDAVASKQCPSWCAEKFSSCKETGCYDKAPRFGGGQTCGLKKS